METVSSIVNIALLINKTKCNGLKLTTTEEKETNLLVKLSVLLSKDKVFHKTECSNILLYQELYFYKAIQKPTKILKDQ